MDSKEPRPDLWIDIANEISSETRQKSLSKSFVWWRAAAVLLLFITSLLVLEKFVSGPEKEMVVVNQQLLEAVVDEVLAASSQDVERYRAGEKKVVNFLMGQVMKRTQGKANPGAVREILLRKLED